MKKNHPNKTVKELLIAGIHAYGVNMWCAGKFHAIKTNASEENEKRYSHSADEIMASLIEMIDKDLIIKEVKA